MVNLLKRLVDNSSSQKQNASEGQNGCEACIRKDEIIADLYEALKEAQVYTKVDDRVHFKVTQVLNKAEGKD